MSLVLFSMLAYLYAFWCAYVLVMGIYRAHLSQRLVGLNKVLALPVVGFGYLMDVAANLFIAPLVFLDWPREALVTARLIRYKRTDTGWRNRLATFICEHLLDVFDPTGAGGHVPAEGATCQRVFRKELSRAGADPDPGRGRRHRRHRATSLH